MSNRDILILQKIVAYCDEIAGTCQMFDKPGLNLKDYYMENYVFQNACCMCILQIGELAGRLTEQAISGTPDVPWRQIRGMRNICAHNYGKIDPAYTWETIQHDIPKLKRRCEEYINAL